MKELRALEQLAESVLEGGFARALRPKLQPVEIAKALEKEMEASRMIGADAPIVANHYSVYLHPEDLASISAFSETLVHQLAAYLHTRASQLGVRPLSHPVVRLLPSTSKGRRGRIQVKGAFVDSPSGSSSAELQSTREIAVVARALPDQRPVQASPLEPAAYLLDPTGLALPLSAGGTSLGRSIDNDIVVEATGVSRRHARIAWENGRFVLTDLGSMNGTLVSNRKVTRHLLVDGDVVAVGGIEYRFRIGEP